MNIGSIGSGTVFKQTLQASSANAGNSFDDVLASATKAAPASQIPANDSQAAGEKDPLAPHMMDSKDPLLQHLTQSQKEAFNSLYNIKITDAGEIISPMDMPPNELHSALATMGQIASDRANGRIDDSKITLDYIQQTFQHFSVRADQGLPLFEDDDKARGVDVKA